MNMNMEHIKNNYHLLVRTIDPLDEMIAHLSLRSSAFANKRSTIVGAQTPEAKNGILLEIVCTSPAETTKAFLDTLMEYGQSHVVNIIQPSTASDAVNHVADSPLSENQHQKLCSKLIDLSKFVDPFGGLVEEMVSRGAFTLRDKHHVECFTTHRNKALAIVEIMLRKSQKAYDQFINSLTATQQSHVVFILEGKGEQPVQSFYVLFP